MNNCATLLLPVYSAAQIRKGLSHPALVGRELNRIFHSRFGRRDYNPNGVDVFERDWDTLLILDAFRYDLFEELASKYDLPDNLTHVESTASCTPEFLAANLEGKDLTDTVYVTATTMLYRENVLSDDLDLNLHAVEDVWEDSIEFGEWGVLPETMSERGLEAIDEYPNKRVVVHYIQPHIPFVGPKGREYFGEDQGQIWTDAMEGDCDVSTEGLWECYQENAELIIQEVADVLPKIPGKTVVTADHGQMIGDRSFPVPTKEYGHPCNMYAEPLVKVPWLEYENDSRRRIVAEQPSDEYERGNDELDEKARKHLRQLGYVE